MTAAGSGSVIQCPIGLFGPQEAKIEALTGEINAAKSAHEKAPLARELVDQVTVLLQCASFDRTNPNCRHCRRFSELRRETAALIVKVGTWGTA